VVWLVVVWSGEVCQEYGTGVDEAVWDTELFLSPTLAPRWCGGMC